MSNQVTTAAPAAQQPVKFKKQSQVKEIWRRFRKNKGAMIGLIMLLIIVVALLCADIIVDYELAVTQDLARKNEVPSAEHIFGLDSFGRDLFARVLHGGRSSLGIAIIATITSCLFGSALGAIAGYFGGWVDTLIMRGLDIFMSVPDILRVSTQPPK